MGELNDLAEVDEHGESSESRRPRGRRATRCYSLSPGWGRTTAFASGRLLADQRRRRRPRRGRLTTPSRGLAGVQLRSTCRAHGAPVEDARRAVVAERALPCCSSCNVAGSRRAAPRLRRRGLLHPRRASNAPVRELARRPPVGFVRRLETRNRFGSSTSPARPALALDCRRVNPGAVDASSPARLSAAATAVCVQRRGPGERSADGSRGGLASFSGAGGSSRRRPSSRESARQSIVPASEADRLFSVLDPLCVSATGMDDQAECATLRRCLSRGCPRRRSSRPRGRRRRRRRRRREIKAPRSTTSTRCWPGARSTRRPERRRPRPRRSGAANGSTVQGAVLSANGSTETRGGEDRTATASPRTSSS